MGRTTQRQSTSFNPRTRTGCDGQIRLAAPTSYVSTHAPARGATTVVGAACIGDDVSTHAPARGATGGPATSLR